MHKGGVRKASHLYAQFQGASAERVKADPFILIKLISLSPNEVEKIQSIENCFDLLVKRDQALIGQMARNPRSLVAQLKRFHEAAMTCFEEIKRIQLEIEQGLEKFFANPLRAATVAARIANRKVLWMHLDEMLFLLSKYKLLGGYFSLLHSKLNAYTLISQFQQHSALQALRKQCQESIEFHPGIVFVDATCFMQTHIKAFVKVPDEQAYRHLRCRLRRVLKYPPRASSSVSTLRNVPLEAAQP